MNARIACDERISEALGATLDSLKDFQRATVDRIMALYSDPSHSQRVLVADEVGLGKTIIAKGVIARLLLEWNESRPLRVTYICSNLALATENRKKLAVFRGAEQSAFVREPSFGRLAEVALSTDIEAGNGKILEVCSLTPATSFSLTQGAGNRRERLIIFCALLKHEDLQSCREGLTKLFQERVSKTDEWQADVTTYLPKSMHDQILKDFHRELELPVGKAEQSDRTWIDVIRKISIEGVTAGNSFEESFLRKIRYLFAKCCASNLEADLFILDEFQRFKDLISVDQNNEQALIARQVFSKPRQGKILLLSATPFKAMSTLSDDEQDEAHLSGLKQVLSFLNLGPLDSYEPARQALQHELFRLKHDHVQITDLSERARNNVEQVLRPLIARTERAQIASDVDSVLTADLQDCGDGFSDLDIETYIEHDKLSNLLKSDQRFSLDGQFMEFFKSAAWPLSFSSGYQVQEILKNRYATQDLKLVAHLRRSKSLWLPRERVNDYQLKVAEDAPNAKVRKLTKHLFGDGKTIGPEMLLWIPPSLPHYPLSGPFEKHQSLSKTLVFSAWAMVPRMLSGLMSYESERRVLGKSKPESGYFPPKRLNKSAGESASNSENVRIIRLDAGELANWVLLYPAKVLTDIPFVRSDNSLESILAERQAHFQMLLAELKMPVSIGRNRKYWYLSAPILLDQKYHPGWFQKWIDGELKADHPVGVQTRLKEFGEKFSTAEESQVEIPRDLAKDLATYLAWLSIGSPAVCAYRALCTVKRDVDHQRDSSAIALSFISLFNSIAGAGVIRRFSKLIKKQHSKPSHWKSIAQYCAQGGLQSVLEEYLYMLHSGENLDTAVKTLRDVLRTSPSSVKIWDVRNKADDNSNMRCHYAVPFGTQKMSDESGQERVVSIRESFNSPFRPFVLTSTSIGQEGLDFHWYCGEIVHWNLPENPIDLEQREGRISRYQSLTVRRRIAESLAHELTHDHGWKKLFERASMHSKQTDLTPYWHFPSGQSTVRRVVPLLPLSQETYRYPQMLKILSLYRLAFGQPGQHELLEYLQGLQLTPEEVAQLKQRMMVNLAPINYPITTSL